jgi:hypothetical protein
MNSPSPPTDPAPDDDPSSGLAALLQQAYRTEPAEESLTRLEQTWWQLRRGSRRRLIWQRSLMAAATVMVVATLGTASLFRRDYSGGETTRRPKSTIAAESPPPPEQKVADGLKDPAGGFTPTLAQEVLFTVRSRDKKAARLDLAALLTPHAGKSLDAATVLAESGWSLQQLKTSLERDWPRLPDECQPLAVALLVDVGGRQSLATLRRMARDESLRSTAVRALLASSGYADLATPLEIAPAAEVAALLLSDPEFGINPAPVEAYLTLVYQIRTREGTLTSLARMPVPPIDILMAALDAEQKSQRVAAALALGELGGTEVTQRLIELVTSGNRRHAEAWLAVVQCRGPLADEFLALAARNPLLLGHYNAAQIRKRQFMP